METIQYINFKPPLCYDQSIKKPGRRLHTAHVSWAHTPMQLISLTLRLLWAPTLVRTSQSSFCFCCRSAGLRRSTSKQRETRTGNSEHQHLCLQVAFTDVTAGQAPASFPPLFPHRGGNTAVRERSRDAHSPPDLPAPPQPQGRDGTTGTVGEGLLAEGSSSPSRIWPHRRGGRQKGRDKRREGAPGSPPPPSPQRSRPPPQLKVEPARGLSGKLR